MRWPKDVPRQDRSDVGWQTERGVKRQAGRERNLKSSKEVCVSGWKYI